MTVRNYIVGQFKKPHGAVGHLAGWIMANRLSNRERNAWTIGLLDIQPDSRILEIGCGPGLALAMCAKRLKTGKVVGLDHSQTILHQARQRNVHFSKTGLVELHHGGLETLAELDGPFDKVFSANVAQFFPDKAEAFAAVFEVTAPGGLVASTFQPRSKNPTRQAAIKFAKDAERCMTLVGFEEIRTEELPLDPVPAVCVLGIRPH